MGRLVRARWHLCRVGVLIAVAVGLMAGSVTTAFGYGWTKVSTPATQAIPGVSFTSDDNGWIVTQNGLAYHTSSAGSTWTTVPVDAAADLGGVAFVDALHGWITGQSGTIRHTVDGGTNWEQQFAGYSVGLAEPEVLDTQRAWIPMPGAGGAVLRTTDGTGWTAALIGNGASMFDVSFTDPLNGWVVGSDGVACTTQNGGSSWTPCSPIGSTHWLQSVSAVDSTTAYAVSSWGDVLRTSDRGASWDTTQLPVPSLFAVEWRGDGEAWAAGFGAIYHTRDSGDTWQLVYEPAGVTLRALSFPSTASGYAVGDNGAFYRYAAPAPPVPNSVIAADADVAEVTWTASPDAAYYQYRYGDSTGTAAGTSTSVALSAFGTTSIEVRAVTSEGLLSPWAHATITNNPVSAPVLTADSIVNANRVELTWHAVPGATRYAYRLNGGGAVETTSTGVTIAPLLLGDNTLEVRAHANHSVSGWVPVNVEYVIPQAQALLLTTTPSTLVYSATSVTVGGTTGGHATTVTVEVKAYGGDWTPTGTVLRSDTTGVLRTVTIPIRRKSYVRLRFAGDARWLPATSNVRTVYYKPLIKTPSVPKVYRNRRFTTSMKVYTPSSNTAAVVTLTYYRKVGVHWKRVTKLTAKRGAWKYNRTVFSRSYTPKTRGTWKVSAAYRGKRHYSDGSKSTTFRVR